MLDDPSVSVQDVIDRTGMESAVVKRTMGELRRRKLMPVTKVRA
jgi:hypothetical protein